MKHIDNSPIDNSLLKPFISCIDYTVSKEKFTILKDEANDFLITSPRPNDEDLGGFYESEDYISHSDTKKSLFDRVYHLVRNYTIKRKIKLIASFWQSEKSILDFGAGTGDFLAACKHAGWKVNGIEPNEKAREIAEGKLKIKLFDAITNMHNTTFDVITMWHVLEHVPNLKETIIALKKMLNPNGTLVIAVPNHKSYDASYYKEFWAAYDVPRHLWHFSRKAIEGLFSKEGMKVEKVLPMKFDAYYVSLLSEKYKTGTMNFIKAFYIGFKSNSKARSSKEYSSHIYIIKNS